MNQSTGPPNGIITPLLHSGGNCVMLDGDAYVKVPRQSLETEHRQLISRLQELRRLLGYPALLTGKERRRQAQNRISPNGVSPNGGQ